MYSNSTNEPICTVIFHMDVEWRCQDRNCKLFFFFFFSKMLEIQIFIANFWISMKKHSNEDKQA